MNPISAPKDVVDVLQKLCDDLRQAAGTNLVSVIVYGGLARGRYQPNRSDVNLAVILRDTSTASLAAVAAPLKTAWRAIRVEPFILALAEIPKAVEFFPTKFLDIQLRHTVLLGDDPFVGLLVSPRSVLVRIEQDLRNLQMRIRRRFISLSEDPAGLASALSGITTATAVNLAALLDASGKAKVTQTESDLPEEVFSRAATEFNLDGQALQQLARLRDERRELNDVRRLWDAVVNVLERAAEIAASHKAS